MAPEMIKQKPYGLAVDIWALGALMHQLLAMKTPFYNISEAISNNRVCNEALDFDAIQHFEIVTPLAKELLHGMLRKDAAARLTIE